MEEAILYLLRYAGYRTVTSPDGDPTLSGQTGFLRVKGRGEEHQIDAIADFSVVPPFAFPLRLLIEAKCYRDNLGIEIVRNAVGVMKDLGEYWLGKDVEQLLAYRYTYRYAIFSATPFTRNAQRYAFAQDIYLFPLSDSRFFRPVLESIAAVTERDLEELEMAGMPVVLSTLREDIRLRLRESKTIEHYPLFRRISNFHIECNRIKNTLLGVLPRGFVVFLVSAPGLQINGLGAHGDAIRVRIMRDADGGRGFYIFHADTGQKLFSFDVPKDLFKVYAEKGSLTDEAGRTIKGDHLHTIHAFWVPEGREPRILTFRLDPDWCRNVGIALARQ